MNTCLLKDDNAEGEHKQLVWCARTCEKGGGEKEPGLAVE